ncbi:hypothetical protein HWV62_25973 [Athelia sp. TMB]|nr:hypothetical protein HWV62_25973 [Athelia sp. TMB]
MPHLRCPFCKAYFDVRGFKQHAKACKSARDILAANLRAARNNRQSAVQVTPHVTASEVADSSSTYQPNRIYDFSDDHEGDAVEQIADAPLMHLPNNPSGSANDDEVYAEDLESLAGDIEEEFVQFADENYDAYHDFPDSASPSPSPPPISSLPTASPLLPAETPPPSSFVTPVNEIRLKDDIRTEYHGSSERPSSIWRFEEYGRSRPSSEAWSDQTHRPKPWKPFRERIDFEVADLVHEVAMTKAQTETLLSLMRRCAKGEVISIKNHQDMVDTWEKARAHHTPFEKSSFTVQYAKKDRTYDVHHRPLWDWVHGLLNHPRLIHEFTWDAEKISKWTGHRWERFVHEPWTGDDWWNIQGDLPPGAKPLCLILYADKTRLSSFGTAKAYPVVARCANLPVHIRNSNGIGGGEVVGWLPIVEEEAAESGKKNFVLHKNIVWHEAFRKILEQVLKYSELGHNHKCADAVLRWLFPLILILSADYEEQCIMALIRGLRFRALAPDRLHIDHGGVFLHLWNQMKRHLNDMGRKFLEQVDKQYAITFCSIMGQFPRWRDLNHFNGVMHVTFTDGSKYEDISKETEPPSEQVIIFALHNVVTRAACPNGYLLLKCMRSYLVVDMYFALEVHTETTIQAGKEAVVSFGKDLQRYITAVAGTEYADKDWGGIIKLHYWTHVFDEILAKGVSRNFNTKPNEKLHGPLKKHYLRRTNFKDIAPQILRAEHRSCIARSMKEDLANYDASDPKNFDIPDDVEEDALLVHVYLGAAQKEVTFGDLRAMCKDDVAMSSITATKVLSFLKNRAPDDCHPAAGSSDKVALLDKVSPDYAATTTRMFLYMYSDDASECHTSPSESTITAFSHVRLQHASENAHRKRMRGPSAAVSPRVKVAQRVITTILHGLAEAIVPQNKLHQILTQMRSLSQQAPMPPPPPPQPVTSSSNFPQSYPQQPPRHPQSAYTPSAPYPQAKSELAGLSALLALSQAGPIPTSASAPSAPAIGNIANVWQSLLKAGVVSSTGTPTGAGETAKVEETKVEVVDPSRLAAREYRKSILAQKMKPTSTSMTKTRPNIVHFLYDRLSVQCKQCGIRFAESTSGKKDMQDHLAMHFRPQPVASSSNFPQSYPQQPQQLQQHPQPAYPPPASYPQANSEPADLSALLALSQAGPIPTSASAPPAPAIGNIANLWQSLLKAGVVSSTATPTGAGETAKVEETKVEVVDPPRLAAREYRKSFLAQKMKLTSASITNTSGKKDMQDHLDIHFRHNRKANQIIGREYYKEVGLCHYQISTMKSGTFAAHYDFT